ncbi:Zinc finger, GRF-type [Sesbania bispinosa]|nr:Zinc finger, GRF-type [Sesbania bispinosa]
MDSRRKGERTLGSRSLPTTRPSSSKSSASSSHSKAKTCKCGYELLLLTSNTSKNPGRVFWRCRNWGRNNSCNYFRWADEEVTEDEGKDESLLYYDNQVEDVMRKNQKLQKKLRTERAKAKKKFLACGFVLGSHFFGYSVLCNEVWVYWLGEG